MPKIKKRLEIINKRVFFNYLYENDKNILKAIFLVCCFFFNLINSKKKNELKLAICTMAKEENLYLKEYIDYYKELGFDHIFIFDDNDPNIENITIDSSYNNFVTIYDYRHIIKDQKMAYTLCYEMHKNEFDWVFMNDIDEYLVIRNDTIRNYLSRPEIKKCDFIKIHWIVATDNNLLHYDNRLLRERFKGPYLNDTHIKTIVKGNIDGLQYDVHSPYSAAKKRSTCNNKGKILFNNEKIFFQDVFDINIDYSYIIHYKYKSTEEYIKKYKRGYRWENMNFMSMRIDEYFTENNITLQKIEYVEKELNLNLSKYREKIGIKA